MATHVLIVEDDHNIADLLRLYLEKDHPSLPLGGKMTLLKSNKSPMNSKIFLKFQEKNQIFS